MQSFQPRGQVNKSGFDFLSSIFGHFKD